MRAKQPFFSGFKGITSLIVGLLLVATLLPSGPLAVSAQGDNLLQNGGFEGDYVTVRGDVTKQVATGWEPWNVSVGTDASSGLNREPEYGPAPNNRVRSGEAAQEYNTFFAPHDAGLFQRVPVTAGTQLRFSAFIYVWSTTDFSNINESINPLGVRVQVGIDPAGGTNPESSNIVWSDLAEYYDEYRENSVTAVATSNAVTVYVRSIVERENGVSAIYVDDAQLESLGVVEPGETPDTPIPTTPPPPTNTPPPAATTPPTATTPTATAAPTTPTPTPQRTPFSEAFPNEVAHTVTFGDTVIGLAQRYNSSVEAIIAVNELPASGLIFVNQQLTIPVPAGQGTPVSPPPGGGQDTAGVYTVRRGDTLFSIAAANNTTVARLAQHNNIVNPARIFPGQEIRIPPADGSAPAPPAGPPTAAPISGQPPAAPPAAPAGGTGIVNYVDPTGALIHIVQPGENVFRIGLRYNVTWDRIARANGIFNPNFIVPGQRLVIPR